MLAKTMVAVTLGALFRCFLSKRRDDAVVCDRSSFSYTTLLQHFVPGQESLKKFIIQNNGINKLLT